MSQNYSICEIQRIFTVTAIIAEVPRAAAGANTETTTMSRLIMNWGFVLRLCVVICWSSLYFAAAAEDNNENCKMWAERGECDKNPGYMLAECQKSCDEIAAAALKEAEELKAISSFFDLSAKDIFGETLEFKKFKGEVTVVVNVASECGYTDSHYRGLVELWKRVENQGKKVNILAFPCNQFGQQEPGTHEEINEFAVEEYGVEFTMMEKVDVNGPFASIVYKYLKSEAGPSQIQWNFATYYVISPDGTIDSYSNVDPMNLKGTVMGLLHSDEL